ncbi:hypothetical protein DEU38_103173 [Rhodococcus sp. AG1013]|uniref:hypothetical protein n=1 Tax=Rhodococcus sp. AG1013 TaxID=2183996 RepID=UPI000E2C9713|nr:hypothetical protein [Rhodococcus sp. AG1013]RDI32440.1 hypothetical protein DEU38_103173 [Rhodococcus sp. AG1013]
MTADPLEHLDFTLTCDLTEDGVGCERPARWIADIHMHTDLMPRVAICDHHADAHRQMQQRLQPILQESRCPVCQQVMMPNDYIRNQEPL